MADTVVYSRRISRDEAREGYILVTKDKLPLFPPCGQTFEMRRGRLVRQVQVESPGCSCHDAPHEHYRIPWNGLTFGHEVFIKPPTNGGRYVLTQSK